MLKTKKYFLLNRTVLIFPISHIYYMFGAILSTDYLQNKMLDAMDTVKKDRQNYTKIMDDILDYCTTNKLILSDRNVLAGTQDDPMYIYDYKILIYTAFPAHHGTAIINRIYQKVPDSIQRNTMRLKTVRYGEELHIEYDTRILAMIFKVQAHKSKEPYSVVQPVIYGGRNYFPPEIELIDICYSQYNPQKYSDREKDRQYFDIFYEQADRRREAQRGGSVRGVKKISKTGAYKLPKQPIRTPHITTDIVSEPIGGDCRDLRRQFVEGFKLSIIKDFIPEYNSIADEPLVLLGVWAVQYAKAKDQICANPEKIQIVGQISPDTLLLAIKKYAARLTKNNIVYKEQELHIPKDFRTCRITYYMSVEVDRRTIEKPFLDLFNCAEFDCVPYFTIGDICIADHWMILRFLFIDLWIVKMVHSMNLIGKEIFQKKTAELWAAIKTMASAHKELFVGQVQWTGIYRNIKVDKKIMDDNNKRAFPYYPAVYAAQHDGQLRHIERGHTGGDEWSDV